MRVQAQRQSASGHQPPHVFRVSYHKLSVLLNIAFVCNLASTPLLAYISEPFPWNVSWLLQDDPKTTAALDSLHESVMTTFRSVFNNHTMPDGIVCMNDEATSSHVARHILTIAPAAALENRPFLQYKILNSFPGAIFYGEGLRGLVYSFLAANDTTRQATAWSRCQNVRLLSILMSESCTWIESLEPIPSIAKSANSSALPEPPDSSTRYTVYHGVVVYEAAAWCWFKLVYRTLLTGFVLWMLWSKYYCHVRTLHAQLRALGLVGTSKYTQYCILIGDPTALVVSNPVVAVVMVFDIWVNPVFLSMAAMRVGQFSDPYMFAWGCMYSSRNVWCAFLAMQLLTKLIKRCKCEHRFRPVDPVVLTIAAYLYGGPVVVLCVTTPVMILFHLNWGHFVPASEKFEAIECLSGLVVVSTLLASLPIVYSAALSHFRRQKHGPKLLTTAPSSHVMPFRIGDDAVFGNMAFNDLKHRVLYAWSLPSAPGKRGLHGVADSERHSSLSFRKRGGSFHRLVRHNARYHSAPLFSLLAVDVFVFCLQGPPDDNLISPDNTMVAQQQHVRLSLLLTLDLQTPDPDIAITVCGKDHRKSVYTVGNVNDCNATQSSTLVCLHPGTSQWLL